MILAFAYVLMCASVQQTPERVGQGEAVYEVVSLQREAERSNEERGRLASPTEEEEADEGMKCFLFLFCKPHSVSLFFWSLKVITLNLPYSYKGFKTIKQ